MITRYQLTLTQSANSNKQFDFYKSPFVAMGSCRKSTNDFCYDIYKNLTNSINKEEINELIQNAIEL